MKEFLRRFPAVLSLVLLAAHFLRRQDLFLVALNLGLIPFIFLQKAWFIRALRVYLALGALVWVYTMWMIVMERKAMGLPFLAVIIILGSVALFTLMSAFVAPAGKSGAGERLV
ncbi:MAG: hypothetical protein ACP5IL_16360 [Syntrophobacteraceae bacterium]